MGVGEGTAVGIAVGPTVGASVGAGDGELMQPAIASADNKRIKAIIPIICFMVSLCYFLFASLETHYGYNGIGLIKLRAL
jgi:hypothetical protein